MKDQVEDLQVRILTASAVRGVRPAEAVDTSLGTETDRFGGMTWPVVRTVLTTVSMWEWKLA